MDAPTETDTLRIRVSWALPPSSGFQDRNLAPDVAAGRYALVLGDLATTLTNLDRVIDAILQIDYLSAPPLDVPAGGIAVMVAHDDGRHQVAAVVERAKVGSWEMVLSFAGGAATTALAGAQALQVAAQARSEWARGSTEMQTTRATRIENDLTEVVAVALAEAILDADAAHADDRRNRLRRAARLVSNPDLTAAIFDLPDDLDVGIDGEDQTP